MPLAHHWGVLIAGFSAACLASRGLSGTGWSVRGILQSCSHSSSQMFSLTNLKIDLIKILMSATFRPFLRIKCSSYVY